MLQSLNRRLLLLLIVSLIGTLIILYITRWGTGLSEDSLMYNSGAEGLLNGRGFSYVTEKGAVAPIINWPPMYSLALTPFGLAGVSVIEGARWLNALLFGLSILLIGYMIYRDTAFWPAIFGSLLFLTSVLTLEIYAMAWSEPLYISLGLAGLYFLDNYIKEPKVYPLIIAALLTGAAVLTRYVGVAMIVTLCLSVLIFSKQALLRRFIDCLIAGLVSSLPLLLWVIRNRVVSGHISTVESQIHLITARHILDGIYSVSLWLLPERTNLILRGAVLAIVGGAFLLMIVRLRKSSLPSICYLNALYVLVYCLVLAIFISFIAITFDARYLSPVFVSVVIILACCLGHLSLQVGKSVRIGITVLCVLSSLYYAGFAISKAKKIRQDGLGFEGRRWKQSEIISLARNLPDDVRIYANAALAIHFLTQREIKYLPTRYDSGNYLRQLEEIRKTSQSQRTLIICTTLYEHPSYPLENELKQIFSLKKIASASDGSIYEIVTTPAPEEVVIRPQSRTVEK